MFGQAQVQGFRRCLVRVVARAVSLLGWVASLELHGQD
jgi:hypothetical protein